MLLLKRADPSAYTACGHTALHFAVHEAAPEAVALLLEHKADVDCTAVRKNMTLSEK